MDLVTKQSARKRLGFLLAVAVCVYALFSAAIAIYTVDECGNGDESAPKHWSFVPPEWVCESRTPRF